MIGIDYNGFEGVELRTLTVQGSQREFYLFDNALKGTKLKLLRRSANLAVLGRVGAIEGGTFM